MNKKDLRETIRTIFREPQEVSEVDEIPECPVGRLPYGVIMDRRGGVEMCNRESIIDFKPRTEYYGRDNLMYFSMWAESEEHAVKIANERRIQLIAANIWLPHEVYVRVARFQFPEEEGDEDLQDV